jgi:hypothetical protein
MFDLPYRLQPKLTPGAQMRPIGVDAWRLEIPSGPERNYRLAQLDDYGSHSRRSFTWKPPFQMGLKARASVSCTSAGTLGFGLWNNPFSLVLLKGIEAMHFPTLPNAAWFFYASAPNYLSFRDDLPARGWLAATFQSPQWPALVLALNAPGFALLAIPSLARLLRRLARFIIRQDATDLAVDITEWHSYEMKWDTGMVSFIVDGRLMFTTRITPCGPLGLVIWIDNQFAALSPDGRFNYGTLPMKEPAWLEVRDLKLEY